jgi:hypothetical protein
MNKYNDNEMLTSNIEQLVTDSAITASLNIYQYWISSSHNTYLPYDQVFGQSNVCYYKLLSLVYYGGCLEIDTYGINKEKNDIIVNHLQSNAKGILLSDILDIIITSMKRKLTKSYFTNSGPLIITFDNKNLKTIEAQNIFWNIISKKLLVENSNLVQVIDENTSDLTKLPINKMANKILFRWGENNNCNKPSIGNELCPPDSKLPGVSNLIKPGYNRWVNFTKGKLALEKGLILEKNKSVSISNSKTKSVSNKLNIYTMLNTQSNLLRIYPEMYRVLSNNYSNMMHFRNGVNIVAINVQNIEIPWYLNKAVFLPNTGIACTPTEIKSDLCKYSWSTLTPNKNVEKHKPLAYRIKPIWLLNLAPHPGLFKITIKIKDVKNNRGHGNQNINNEYNNIIITYGLDLKSVSGKTNSNIILDNIDPTVPFFHITLKKTNIAGVPSKYQTGCELIWSFNNIDKNNTTDIEIYKIDKTITGNLNKVNLSNDCETSSLFSWRKTLIATVEFKYEKYKPHKKVETNTSVNMEEIINTVRKYPDFSNLSTYDILFNINKLNKYQDEIKSSINKLLFNEKVEEIVEEEVNYESEMNTHVAKTAKFDTNKTTED